MSGGYKNWLLTHKNCQLSLVCQEVGPLCSQCPHYPCCLVLISSVPSEMLCVGKFFSNVHLDHLNSRLSPVREGGKQARALTRLLRSHPMLWPHRRLPCAREAAWSLVLELMAVLPRPGEGTDSPLFTSDQRSLGGSCQRCSCLWTTRSRLAGILAAKPGVTPISSLAGLCTQAAGDLAPATLVSLLHG